MARCTGFHGPVTLTRPGHRPHAFRTPRVRGHLHGERGSAKAPRLLGKRPHSLRLNEKHRLPHGKWDTDSDGPSWSGTWGPVGPSDGEVHLVCPRARPRRARKVNSLGERTRGTVLTFLRAAWGCRGPRPRRRGWRRARVGGRSPRHSGRPPRLLPRVCTRRSAPPSPGGPPSNQTIRLSGYLRTANAR